MVEEIAKLLETGPWAVSALLTGAVVYLYRSERKCHDRVLDVMVEHTRAMEKTQAKVGDLRIALDTLERRIDVTFRR